MLDEREECLQQLRAWIIEGGKGGFISARMTVDAYLDSQEKPDSEAAAMRLDISRWNPFYSGNKARLVRHVLAYLDYRCNQKL